MIGITTYSLKAPVTLRVALVADLHNHPQAEVLQAVKEIKPDIIAVAGDFYHDQYQIFLNAMTEIAPTFVSLGNHETVYRNEIIDTVSNTKAVLLDNKQINFRDTGIYIGGMSSEYNLKWLERFSAMKGYKILLCHHPEYYKRFVKGKDIDLILAGHAHGGQIRLFGKGLFAPGQGLFPKYTSGVYDGRLLVSRGIANMVKIPRLFNKGEVICIELKKE